MTCKPSTLAAKPALGAEADAPRTVAYVPPDFQRWRLPTELAVTLSQTNTMEPAMPAT
jgi:hypothetical protein